MNNNEQNSSRMPRPWLVVVSLVVLMAIAAARLFRQRLGNREKTAEEKTAELQAIVASAPESSAVSSGTALSKDMSGRRVASTATNLASEVSSASLGESFATRVQHKSGDASENRSTIDRKAALTVAEGAASDWGAEIEKAKTLVDKGDFVSARSVCWHLLDAVKDSNLIAEIEKMLGQLNVELFLTPREAPEKTVYVVQKGDSLEKIARKFGTTVDLLIDGNDLQHPDLIKAGDRLLVTTSRFSIVISKSRNDMILQMDGRFFKRYAVGTGRHGKTPSGSFVISDKQKDPVWWRPDGKEIPYGDPENILGTRWMSLRAAGDTPPVKGYGIHGTWDESIIGKAESAGCIRMRNADVEELFKFVHVGASVMIRD